MGRDDILTRPRATAAERSATGTGPTNPGGI